jgi:hypothetical protein
MNMHSSSDEEEPEPELEEPEPEEPELEEPESVQPEAAVQATQSRSRAQRRNRMQNAPVRQQISQLKDSMRMFKKREKEGRDKLHEITHRAPSLVFLDSDSD